jgi:hypothetical protein
VKEEVLVSASVDESETLVRDSLDDAFCQLNVLNSCVAVLHGNKVVYAAPLLKAVSLSHWGTLSDGTFRQSAASCLIYDIPTRRRLSANLTQQRVNMGNLGGPR